ncbi:Eco57I restriction-modification methylase domain-containing protein [Nocardia brasiliensis]|uniref:Eco57I restriction-modification methylase domain-containing protein n=1 Tax=Nocardia brasiliensis TaxID=37326 RepID=UPI002455A6D2|nr:DNA methyltransferase [Nocardia brasiliensis]
MGGLLPPDMLRRIATDHKDVPGRRPADYGVVGPRSLHVEAERHWDYLKSVWRELRERLPVGPDADPPADPAGHAIGQWLEPLFAELGFGRLTEVGPWGVPADDGTKIFPVSHRWNHVPLHLVAWNVDLDRRAGGAIPPQSMMQECLNRTESQLWGVLSNGRRVRLLRDSSAFATAAYVEFDLEAIFDGELVSEFVLLYRLLHVSRFEVPVGAAPSGCWLEVWRADAIASGTRALDHQRDGVEAALRALGTGFLQENPSLRAGIDVHAFRDALLRLIYRLIFLFVAEDRGVLHHPGAESAAVRRYARFFSSARLRRHAARRRGTAHTDLYQALSFVLAGLGAEDGRPELGLPALGGLFDDTEADAPIRGLALANEALLTAVRHLSRIQDPSTGRWRQVDYRNMDAEELGSIYESLLESEPQINLTQRTFELADTLGNVRKKTGTYYTPTSLIDTLLDATLDPVIADAQKRGEQLAAAAGLADPADSVVAQLLSMTICDPACGSGHFLVAAARRVAKRVAAVREGNPEPTLVAVRHAMHEVVARCIYGVDINPMAVELAKVSLWLEGMEPGRPMSFLDAHLKCGNALIGATPAVLWAGIPTKAFKLVEGDDRAVARSFERQNEAERDDQMSLFERTAPEAGATADFARAVRRIAGAPGATLAEVRGQASAYREWTQTAEHRRAVHIADAWCAAFVWPKTAEAPMPLTHDGFRALRDSAAVLPPEQALIVTELAGQQEFRFFHWHLEFPEIFSRGGDPGSPDAVAAAGWSGGFSCVISNPPWDKIDFEDKKYFDTKEPALAAKSGNARRIAIAQWAADPDNEEAVGRYRRERRAVKASFHFAADSGVFPLCAKGLSIKGVNSLQRDQLFAELLTSIVAADGRVGCIIPTAIATGSGGQYLFQSLARRGGIRLLYDFENRKKLFREVDSRLRFCLLAVVGPALREPRATFGCYLHDVRDLDDADRVFTLEADEIALINPNTGTLPTFRTRRDADLTAAIHRRIPVLWDETVPSGNAWRILPKRLFDMTDDSDLFRTREQLERDGWRLDGAVFERDGERMLPLYEAKMVDFFNHRAADVVKSETAVNRQNQPSYLAQDELSDPSRSAMPLSWIQDDGWITTVREQKEVEVAGVAERLRELHWDRAWLCGWCDVTSATNERTAIPAFIPRVAVGHKFPLMFPHTDAPLVGALIACQSSLVVDYVARQKVAGTSMALFLWKQLPVPTPEMLEPHLCFVVPRVLELTYTAYDMSGLAADLGDSPGASPFHWNEDRRAQIRAELDAYFFHLYGVDRPDVEYILDTFQTETGGLKNNEIARFGRYRTRDLVLAEYARMAAAAPGLDAPLIDGETYTSPLSPPPGYGPRHTGSVHSPESRDRS